MNHKKTSRRAINSLGIAVVALVLPLIGIPPISAASQITVEDVKKQFGDVNAPIKSEKLSLLPLQLAAVNDDMGARLIQVLLAAGANINKLGPDGGTALHTASRRGAAKNIRLLVKSNADVNLKNRQGATALLTAIEYQQFNAVKALLDAGANPNITNNTGNTAVHATVNMGDIDIAMKILPLLMRYDGKTELKNNDGATPLQVALSVPMPEKRPIVQFLLDVGTNPNIQDALGDTPLHNIAAQQTTQRDQFIPLLRMLIKAGANINAKNKDGETPLYKSIFEACYLGVAPIISKFLLQHGADKSIKANDGSSAMDLIHVPELHCNRQVQQLLATSHGRQVKKNMPENSRLSAVIKAYVEYVDKAGRAYQYSKEKVVKIQNFSGLRTRKAVQIRQHIFADYRDKVTNLIFLIKDAKKRTWKIAQDNKVHASRKAVDAAVVWKLGHRMNEKNLELLQMQFYWADAYYNVLTLLDQYWGAWHADERKKTLNASDKDLQSKLNKEIKVIGKLETYMKQQNH